MGTVKLWQFNNSYVCIFHSSTSFSTFNIEDGTTVVSNVNVGGNPAALENYTSDNIMLLEDFIRLTLTGLNIAHLISLNLAVLLQKLLILLWDQETLCITKE